MKKNLIILAFVFGIFCSMSFAPGHRAKETEKSLAPAATVTVTLTGGSAGSSYRIVFNNANYDKQFPMPYNGSSTITVPSGTYTVAIVYATPPGSYHTYSGIACAVNYSGSGNMVQWNNVSLCSSTAQFGMN